jgi:hypothetical protein
MRTAGPSPVDERGLGHRRGRRLAAVDGVHPVPAGVVVQEEPAPADAGRERLGHAERGGRRHRGVHGVAAVAQHLQADPGGVGIHRGHRAAEADRVGSAGHRRTGQRGGLAPAPITVSTSAPTAARRSSRAVVRGPVPDGGVTAPP